MLLKDNVNAIGSISTLNFLLYIYSVLKNKTKQNTFHNTSTHKVVIIGFKTKGRGSQINRQPEQIKGLDTQRMVRLILAEQRKNVI